MQFLECSSWLIDVSNQKGAPNDTAPALINPHGTPTRQCSTVAGQAVRARDVPTDRQCQALQVACAKLSPTLFRKRVNVSCIPVSIRPSLLILLELSSYRRRQCVSRRFAQPKIAYDSYAIGVHGQSHDRTRRKRSIANDPRTTLAKLDLFGSTISKAKCREGMWDGQVDPLLGSEWTLNRAADHAVIINFF